MMRIKLVFSSLLILILLLSYGLSAQTRSEVRVKIGSLPYYIHTVQKNETIGGLAVTYHVTKALIEEANPTIEDIQKIKIGQKILIPNFSEFEARYPVSEWDILLYKAKDGEKLKNIAKAHRAEVKDIKNVNPGIDNKPKSGAGILIPVRRGEAPQGLVANGKKAEPAQDTKTKEMKNPALTFDWGANKQAEEEKVQGGGAKTDDCRSYNYDTHKEVFTLSILMPLYLNDDKRDNSGMFFLEGALLAIESIKRDGLSLNVNIMDVATKEGMAKALASKELEKSDLIIGPFAMSELRPLAAYAQKKEISVVAPYEPNALKLAESNPFIFQIYPNDQSIYKKLISEKYEEGVNPILVLPATTDSVMLANYRKTMKEKFGTYKEYVHEMGQPSRKTTMAGMMSKQKRNLLFVCSNREAFVSDLMDRLRIVKQGGYPISVYGRAQWLNFRIIDIARYFDLDLHLVHPFHVDYANEEVKQFIRTFRLSYNNEPTQYAFQGYDVTYYFLQAMKRYGSHFAPCLSDFPSKLLQSRYLFKRIGDKGGYVNSEAFMLEYTPELNVIRY